MQNIFNFFGDEIEKVDGFFSVFRKHHAAIPPEIGIPKSVIFVKCFFVLFVFLLVSGAIAGEGAELFDCRSVEKERLVKEFADFNISKLSGQGQFYLCWSEDRTQLGGSPAKFSDTNSLYSISMGVDNQLYGEKISNRACNKNSDNCSTNSDQCPNNRITHLLFGASIGIFSFAVCFYSIFGAWYWLTQRDSSADGRQRSWLTVGWSGMLDLVRI